MFQVVLSCSQMAVRLKVSLPFPIDLQLMAPKGHFLVKYYRHLISTVYFGPNSIQQVINSS